MGWYVAETHFRQETRAQDNIRALVDLRTKARLNFETRLPTSTKKIIIRNKETISERPLFGPFVFVKFDPEADLWRAVCYARGVKRLFLERDGWPIPIRDEEAVELLDRCAAGPEEFEALAQTMLIKSGETARITEGAFAGFLGECLRTGQGRALIVLSMFKKSTPVEIPIGWAKAVA